MTYKQVVEYLLSAIFAALFFLLAILFHPLL